LISTTTTTATATTRKERTIGGGGKNRKKEEKKRKKEEEEEEEEKNEIVLKWLENDVLSFPPITHPTVDTSSGNPPKRQRNFTRYLTISGVL